MTLTQVNLLNLPEGATVKIGNETKTATASGGVNFFLAVGDYEAMLTYEGNIYELNLKVGKSIADKVQEQIDTLGLKTQIELDHAVAEATEGYYGQAQLDQAVATALKNSQGYIDIENVKVLPSGSRQMTFSTADKTPKATKLRYLLKDGATSVTTIPSAGLRVTDLNTDFIRTVEVIAGNNRVLDKLDLDFEIFAPTVDITNNIVNSFTVSKTDENSNRHHGINIKPIDTTYKVVYQNLDITKNADDSFNVYLEGTSSNADVEGGRLSYTVGGTNDNIKIVKIWNDRVDQIIPYNVLKATFDAGIKAQKDLYTITYETGKIVITLGQSVKYQKGGTAGGLGNNSIVGGKTADVIKVPYGDLPFKIFDYNDNLLDTINIPV